MESTAPNRYPRIVEIGRVAVAIAVVICLFYYEIIFLGRSFVPIIPGADTMPTGPYGFGGLVAPDPYQPDLGAFLWAIAPWEREVSSAYASLTFPLWNAHQGFGAPLLANAQAGGLDVLRLPVLLVNSATSWDLYFLARSFLGGLATYAFLRMMRLGSVASFTAAVAFTYSGHMMSFGTNIWIEIYFLIPILFLATEWIFMGRRRLGFTLTALAVGMSILAGMPEVTLCALLLSAGYGVFCLGGSFCETRSFSTTVPLLTCLGGAWITGIALAAPLLLTLAEYIPVSYSIHSTSRHLGMASAPVSELVFLGVPFLDGFPRVPIVKDAGVVNIHTYAGLAVLMLAFYSLLAPQRRSHRNLTAFLSFAAVLGLAKIYGVPGINQLGGLPGLNMVFLPQWLAPVIGFCLACMAGLGIQRLESASGNRQATLAFLACLVFALIGLLLNWDIVQQGPTQHLVDTLGVALFFATAVWLTVLARPLLGLQNVRIACLALVIAELWTYAPREVRAPRFTPPSDPPFVQFLRENNEEPYRIFAINGILFPNIAAGLGIDDIRSVDALYIDRYVRYIQNFVAPGVEYYFVGATYASPEKDARLLDNPWFDATNTRFVIVKPGDDGFLTRTASMVRGTPPQYVKVYDGEVQIYENRHAQPRAFLVNAILPVTGPDEAIATMKQATASATKIAIVENVSLTQAQSVGPFGGTVQFIKSGATDVTLDVAASSPSFLIVADSYYPGWEATIDGLSSPIFATDLAFEGVFIPTGKHRVEFHYWPRSFTAGLVISLLALVVLLLVATGIAPGRKGLDKH